MTSSAKTGKIMEASQLEMPSMILNVYVYGLTAKSQTITTIYYQCREKRLTKDEEKHT